MQFALADSSWVRYCIAVLDDRVQYRTAALQGFERFDLAAPNKRSELPSRPKTK